jgi:hypothetical protein
MPYKIPSKRILPFISNKKLYNHVKEVLDIAQQASDLAVKNLYSNVVDPFSAIFDALRQEITLINWMDQETARQIQKTMQNALGDFHQAIIGSMHGWENLSVGHVVDVCNVKRKIIAEVKNKYNTTKGSDKKSIYDNLNSQLSTVYKGFTGYYVEIIPKGRLPYNKVFTPSDNVTQTRRPVNERIRVIDGKSFYALASGHQEALKMLYVILPKVISDILGVDYRNVTKDALFMELFNRAY